MTTTTDEFESFGTTWINIFEAQRMSKRSARTLHRWRTARTVRTRRRAGQWEFAAGDLRMTRKANRAAYKTRTFTAGPGRGKRHPDTELIRDALKSGESSKNTAQRFNCSLKTVGRVKREITAAHEPDAD